MNNEIIKAMNRKPKNNTFRKWWSKNGYKVNRVIFFPIWIVMVISEKVQKKLNARQVWSEERVNKILNYYIPRRAEWDAEEKEFYFFDNGYGWSMNLAKKYLKRKDRRWWKNHTSGYGGDVRKYLTTSFELEGFTKKVLSNYSDQTEIIFKLNEKN